LRLLLSFVLAVALWLYVTGQQNPSRVQDFASPLAITTAGMPGNLAVTGNLGSVHIRIRVDNYNGPVTPASFQTYVDLSSAKAGVRDFPVKVIPDPGIAVLGVSPARIRVHIVALITREIAIRARITAAVPNGYSAGPIQLQPNTINVSGPELVVSQVAQALVYIDLSQARSAINGTYQVFPVDSQGAAVRGRLTIDQTQIHIVVPVRPLSSYRTVPVLVSLRGQPKRGFGVVGITVTPAEITAIGSVGPLGRFSSVPTSPVSVSGRGAGRYTQRVLIVLPRGIHSSSKSVNVTTQIAPVEGSSSIEIGISPQNVRPGLVVHTNPAKVLVTVVGPASAVSDAATRIRATLNLFGYGPGTYYLSPTLLASRGLQVQGVYPPTVTVTLGFQ
jgi:YbbR domain-containing protein